LSDTVWRVSWFWVKRFIIQDVLYHRVLGFSNVLPKMLLEANAVEFLEICRIVCGFAVGDVEFIQIFLVLGGWQMKLYFALRVDAPCEQGSSKCPAASAVGRSVFFVT
jgi:hypothetical protein